MDDLVTWLRAVLDERERIARSAADAGAEWSYSENGIYPSDVSGHPGPIAVGPFGYLGEQYGEHIALNDPAAELADVAAKRQILDQAEHWMWNDDRGGPDPMAAVTVRLLALPYAGREGYREEWRP